MTLMEQLLAAGYPRDQMFNHCSDLYIYVTPLTMRVVHDWFRDSGLSYALFCSTFKDQVSGRLMYDVAFQYDDYWKERCRS